MSSPSHAVVIHDVSFAWPDGSRVLEQVSGTFGSGRTGLVGANGIGKSTLLRLIAGDLSTTAGSINVGGIVDYLPQRITAYPAMSLADLLGIGATRTAIRAVAAGSTDPGNFDVIGDDWDVEERAQAALAALDLPRDLDRSVGQMSGGEAMLAAITGVRLRRSDVVLLDEPTNNLDVKARGRLYELLRNWAGAVVVVSHDLALLELMDVTAELYSGSLRFFGGPYSSYRAQIAAEQDAARQALMTAEQTLKKEKREQVKAEERIAHSERQGRKDRSNRRYVPAAINDRRNSAEKAQGARRGQVEARVGNARKAIDRAQEAVRDDGAFRIDIPDPRVPHSRRLAELPSSDGRHVVIQGPERVALVGANGVGKTTLLHRILPTLNTRVGFLPQRLVLDDDATVLSFVRSAAPSLTPGEVRNRLARLLIRGSMVDRHLGTLSGGERFRAALAQLILAEPPSEMLVLDEPTNDLDVTSVEQLIDSLCSYRGGLLVVSHDQAFLGQLNLDAIVHLDEAGRLRRE